MPKSNQSQSEAWYLFHNLWTKAVGTEDYDKKAWLRLEKIILEYEELKRDKPLKEETTS